ncbi:hypothetical protein, partial [Pseudolactococcus yaeyamensis]
FGNDSLYGQFPQTAVLNGKSYNLNDPIVRGIYYKTVAAEATRKKAEARKQKQCEDAAKLPKLGSTVGADPWSIVGGTMVGTTIAGWLKGKVVTAAATASAAASSATPWVVGGTVAVVVINGVVNFVDHGSFGSLKLDNRDVTPESVSEGSGNKQKAPTYPGNNPEHPPGKDYEWRGSGAPGTSQGNWYNPKTGESLHPDLDHPDPIGPHWDYKPGRGEPDSRIFPDGSIVPK